MIVGLLLLAGFGAGAFFIVRKFMYSKGKPAKRKFKGLKDIDNEEITTLKEEDTCFGEEDSQEDDDPMGTLLSR